MKKTTIKKEIEQYEEKCSYCDKIIYGTTENQVLFNLAVHIKAKHGKDNQK